LNPRADDAVKVYASGGVKYDWHRNPTDLIAEVIDYVEQGYNTVKFRLGTTWAWDNVTAEKFIDLYDMVHKEVGDSVGLAVDGNCRLSRDQARVVAFGMQDRGGLWLEEPLPKDDLEGHVALNHSLELPITGGEGKTTAAQFRPWIEAGAFDAVQPDAGLCGISELMRVGELAQRHGVQLIPHSWHNGLMLMANAHAVAALPNSSMVEECMVQGPLKWGVIKGGSRVIDGQLQFGDAPGLGVDIIDDLEERYPYVEGDWRVEVYR
jgi:L-alanine-DL-glutamate epimerase-like enolase superfamily enzyme